mmetsp:Transcript_173842/g.557163  ORF Transcript_173842/g.557163 Transcript_173842/m.557163 type:complete len:264 (+) Transcript_173842:1014-1805(+)
MVGALPGGTQEGLRQDADAGKRAGRAGSRGRAVRLQSDPAGAGGGHRLRHRGVDRATAGKWHERCCLFCRGQHRRPMCPRALRDHRRRAAGPRGGALAGHCEGLGGAHVHAGAEHWRRLQGPGGRRDPQLPRNVRGRPRAGLPPHAGARRRHGRHRRRGRALHVAQPRAGRHRGRRVRNSRGEYARRFGGRGEPQSERGRLVGARLLQHHQRDLGTPDAEVAGHRPRSYRAFAQRPRQHRRELGGHVLGRRGRHLDGPLRDGP